MAKKVTAKTMPMRALEESGVPYRALPQSRKQYTAEGVAQDLGVPVAQVVKAMLVAHSEGHRGVGGSAFALVKCSCPKSSFLLRRCIRGWISLIPCFPKKEHVRREQ